jgi:hypothetical protein
MVDAWTPPLRIHETSGHCRLWLGSYIFGDGNTLQDAADALVARLLSLAMGFRSSGGMRISPELGPPDLGWFEFIYELGEIAAAGGDIRNRVFGPNRVAA